MPDRNCWFRTVLVLCVMGVPMVQSICAPQLDVTKFQCSHMRLIEVPGNINRLTEELDLSNNLIEVLHEDSFHRLHSLRRLVLSHNKIYKITERAFLAIAHTLTYLDLRNNQIMSNSITSFPVTALAPLIQLTYLDLSANPLTIIPTGFLRHMGANLTQLDLSSIPMKLQIQPGAFRGLARLHRLNLAGNTFGEFNEEAFEGLRPSQFSQLSLHGVQWRCDCRLLWFRRWLNHVPRKALFADPLPGGECISPPAFKGRSLLFLNLTDLQCAPRLLGTIPPSHELDTPEPVHVVALDGYNLTLSCVFVSEPKMQVHWYQNGVLIQPHWKRFTQTTTSGSKFTTSLHFHQLNSQLDIGTYQCQTSNQKGSAGKNFMVDVKTQLNPAQGTVRTVPFTYTEQPILQARELGKYLIILSIIAASNIVFFIVGAITYKCIKCRHRSRHKAPSTVSQSAYILSNGQTNNQTAPNPRVPTEIDSNSFVPLLPTLSSVSQPTMMKTIPSGLNSQFHSVQYNFPPPAWPENTATTNPTWTGPDILMPMVHKNPMFPHPSGLRDNFGSDLTHILSPHRTKRMHMLGEQPSPISSDMGYSASTSSRTADRSDPSADRSHNPYRHGRPESASKSCNHHYTLTLKQNDGNQTELVYQPTGGLTGGGSAERERTALRINAPFMRETSLTSKSHPAADKSGGLDPNGAVDLQITPNISPRLMFKDTAREEELDPTCPIHGLEPQHTSCPLHADSDDPLCPVHGSIVDTSIIEKNVAELCAMNEKYKHYGTWSSDGRKTCPNHAYRYSNPNLSSTDLPHQESRLSGTLMKPALRNHTLPR